MATTPLLRLAYEQATTTYSHLQPTLADQLRIPFAVDAVLQLQLIASNRIARAMGSAPLARTK